MLAHIVDSVGKVSLAVADISASSRAQAADIRQVGQALAQIDQATGQNAALVDEVNASGQTLRARADALLRRIAFFHPASAVPDPGRDGDCEALPTRAPAWAGA